MSNRNSMVLLAIVIHMAAFFWSCYQPKSFRTAEELQLENPRFIQAELQKDENAQYIIKWETSPKDIGVDVSVSPDLNMFKEEDQVVSDVMRKEFVFKNRDQGQLYFKLVAGNRDVVILSEEIPIVCK